MHAMITLRLFLSVQCYAWTEYKFTCVCLSVFVRHTFCGLAYRSDPSMDFYSLKDADLRNDVPFGGLDDEYSHLGVQKSPKTPILWA